MTERPKVGDRVRVVFEGEVRSTDDSSVRVVSDTNSSHWVVNEYVTVLAEWPASQPSMTGRSDTALERRLVALEEGLVLVSNNLSHLEAKYLAAIPELQRRTQNVTAASALTARVSKLEEIVSMIGRVFRDDVYEEGDEVPY